MIIDGKKLAEEIINQIAGEVKQLSKQLKLAAVLVGDPSTGRSDPEESSDSKSSGQVTKKFLELKKSAAKKAGIDFLIYEFSETITTKKLRKKIVEISRVQTNSGVIIELPMPAHINTQYVLNAIPEEKDVDVLSQKSQGTFFTNRSEVLPPSVEAVKIIFEKYNIDPKGRNCAVLGFGLLVGKPVSHWLASCGATVSIINEFTPNPKLLVLNADIIISGVGKPNLITADMVKENAIVIDFGYENANGKMVGDVDFNLVAPKTSLITPVPGGIGPVVIAALLKNLVKLNLKQTKTS